MKVTRLYTGDDGKSHFEEVEYDLRDSPVGRVSERIGATGVIFRETPADYNLDFHPAPRRQFIINLDAVGGDRGGRWDAQGDRPRRDPAG